MRKSVLSVPGTSSSSPANKALDLEQIASVEISSEDPHHPFENALIDGKGGWRAAHPGPQVIRLQFDHPQDIRTVRLEFREDRSQRTQEFALYATSAAYSRREVVRQQWTFSPGGSAVEVEEYILNLVGVSTLELEIDPGRHDKQAIASLESITIS